jgi:hypothetical protein
MPVYKDMDKRRADINRNVRNTTPSTEREGAPLQDYTLYKKQCLE